MRSWWTLISGAALIGGAAAIVVAERRRPLRRQEQNEPGRTARNLVMGAMSAVVVNALERPLTTRLAARAERRRTGIAQKLVRPGPAQDLAALLLMDYALYLWHVATHKIPMLWRFHLVHHQDLDMDASTALRFHAADMAISVPFRAAQVWAIGPGRRALDLWQGFFLLSILFHHSNWKLDERTERRLALLLTTPRMHTIHHSTREDETDSNWSSGLSLWDRLHRSFRLDVPHQLVTIGLPAWRKQSEIGLERSMMLPFQTQRDAWETR